MQCRRCGKEIGNSAQCKFCGYENENGNVREMSSAEKNFYDGLTIDTGESEDYNSGQRANSNFKYSHRVFYTSANPGVLSRLLAKLFTGLVNNSLLAKIIVALIAVAFLALMFFVALPMLFLVLAVGFALFVVSRLGR